MYQLSETALKLSISKYITVSVALLYVWPERTDRFCSETWEGGREEEVVGVPRRWLDGWMDRWMARGRISMQCLFHFSLTQSLDRLIAHSVCLTCPRRPRTALSKYWSRCRRSKVGVSVSFPCYDFIIGHLSVILSCSILTIHDTAKSNSLPWSGWRSQINWM